MSDLTPQQIAAWCRSQADKYSSIADTIERDFMGTSGIASGISHTSVHPYTEKLTLDVLKARLKRKSARKSQLALEFDESEDAIDTLVQSPNSGIEYGGRGWLKLIDEVPVEQTLNLPT